MICKQTSAAKFYVDSWCVPFQHSACNLILQKGDVAQCNALHQDTLKHVHDVLFLSCSAVQIGRSRSSGAPLTAAWLQSPTNRRERKYNMFRGGERGVGAGGWEVTEAQGGGDVAGGPGAVPSQAAQPGKQHLHPLLVRRDAIAAALHTGTLDHVRCCIETQNCWVTSAAVRQQLCQDAGGG